MRTIPRRGFIAGGTALMLAPLGVQAQQTGKVYRIGVLTAAPAVSPLHEAFRQGLRELGYVEGQNVQLEFRFAAGANDRLPTLAAELVRANVDLILTDGNAAVHAAKNATTTIPIVMGTSGDPLSTGAVKSLARPGGNVTGLTLLGVELSGKKLEILRAAMPKVKVVAMLVNPANPQAAPLQKETEGAARSLDVRLVPCAAASPAELERAFEAAARARVDAMITMPDAMFWNFRLRLVDLAKQRRLAVMFPEREFVEAGGLIAYGPNVPSNFRRAAVYVDKIFKGARPEDLPVEQPTSIELAINRRTAKTLGVTIPQSLLLRADLIIE